MLVKDAAQKRARYAWFIKQLMEEKERAARERLVELRERQQHLQPIWEKYLELYKLHIKPLAADVDEYHENIHEMRKCEHFLQGQAEHLADLEKQKSIPEKGTRSWTLPPQVERLPYAGPGSKKPKQSLAKLTDQEANDFLKQLKSMDQDKLAELLKRVGAKEK